MNAGVVLHPQGLHERDEKGAATSATILDFKTDRVEDSEGVRRAAGKYGPQLALYRAAAARLLSLPPEPASSIS